MASNRFSGSCENCGGHVPAAAGTIRKTSEGWKVAHVGGCPTAPAPVAPKVALTPTAEQVAIIEAFATGQDLVIEAGAGAAKTSSLVMCADSMPNRTGVYTVFSRKLVEDSADKFGGNVKTSTIHALAFAATVASNRTMAARLRSPRQRNSEIARFLGLDPWKMTYGTETKTFSRDRLAGMAIRAVRQFCTTGDAEPTAQHIEYVEGIDIPTTDGRRTYGNNDDLRRHLLPAVRKAWTDLSAPTGFISWANHHGYYLKLWERSCPVILADFIMVDEAQDISGVMLSIVRQQFGVQKVLVGDSAQAIFGFLGLVDALAIFREEGANVARLTKSFRFGQAVADVANGLLARMGSDMRLTGNQDILATVEPVAEPHCILTRTNAAAVRLFLTALNEDGRPHLVGGAAEIMDFCRAAINLQAGRGTDHRDLGIFDSWAAVQAYSTEDDGADLRLLVKLVDEFGAGVILSGLERNGDERDATVVISTGHKSKGREWASVQIAADFTPPENDGEMGDDALKLAYVCVTRARRALDITSTPHFGLGWPPAAEDATTAPEAVQVPEVADEDESALDLTARYGTTEVRR